MTAVVIMSDAGKPSVRLPRRLFFTGFSQTGVGSTQNSANEQQMEIHATGLTAIGNHFAQCPGERKQGAPQASSAAVTVYVAAHWGKGQTLSLMDDRAFVRHHAKT
jgi:hypothetical protein